MADSFVSICLLICILTICCSMSEPDASVYVNVTTTQLLSKTGPYYASWNIDTSRDRGFFDRNFSDPQFIYLGSQLVPAILRCGGTGNDFLTYEFGNTKCVHSGNHECLNETWWNNLYNLALNSGAQLVFGLNINPIAKVPGVAWDPSNAIELIKYTISNNQEIFGFELGNEQNIAMSPQQEAAAFKTLQSTLASLYPDATKRPKLIGPDPHSYHGDGKDNPTWLGQFVEATKGMMYAITHHEYIEIDSTNFDKPDFLDRTAKISQMVQETVTKYAPESEIWGGEVGPHNGGDGGVCGTYGSTFWYLDTLGTKAKYGYKAFCRQDLIGAAYGLLSDKAALASSLKADSITIHPDYWISVLWHQLVGLGVIRTISSVPSFRAYTHCSKQYPGGLALIVINISPTVYTVSLSGSFGDTRIEYKLSAPAGGILKNIILLNGVELQLKNGKIPDIQGNTVQNTIPLEVQPQSSAFVIYPQAKVTICQ